MRNFRALAKELASDLSHSFGRWVLLSMLAVGAALLLFLFAITNLVYPYQPMVVYGFHAVPEAVCPGDTVSVEIDREIRDDLRVLEIVYQWSERGDPTTLTGGQARYEDVPAMERKTITSSFFRSAPASPGEWQLKTNYDIFGTRLGMPVRQDLDNVTSEDFVRVLEFNDEKCTGGKP